MSREVQYLPARSLKPDPRNPKDHDVGAIHSSVGQFGFVEPVVVDSRTGLIVSGHGRHKTLLDMEEEGVPPPDGVMLDEEGRWLIPVVTGWESKDDLQAAGALIAMNRTTELGGWVDESLFDLLQDLAAAPDGLAGVGYDEEDLESLRLYIEGHAIADGWDGSGEEADDRVDFREGQREIVVVVPEERREELYDLLSRLDWVLDARDRTT